jgi:hypothetical protein
VKKDRSNNPPIKRRLALGWSASDKQPLPSTYLKLENAAETSILTPIQREYFQSIKKNAVGDLS